MNRSPPTSSRFLRSLLSPSQKPPPPPLQPSPPPLQGSNRHLPHSKPPRKRTIVPHPDPAQRAIVPPHQTATPRLPRLSPASLASRLSVPKPIRFAPSPSSRRRPKCPPRRLPPSHAAKHLPSPLGSRYPPRQPAALSPPARSLSPNIPQAARPPSPSRSPLASAPVPPAAGEGESWSWSRRFSSYGWSGGDRQRRPSTHTLLRSNAARNVKHGILARVRRIGDGRVRGWCKGQILFSGSPKFSYPNPRRRPDIIGSVSGSETSDNLDGGFQQNHGKWTKGKVV